VLIRILSDIHGNTEALSAVLDDEVGRKAEVTLCLGDVVGYGAEPSACIATVREVCDLVVMGNHDSGASGLLPDDRFNLPGAKALEWIRGVLTRGEKEWLRGLPIDGVFADSLYICHSDPSNPESWNYIMQPAEAISACESHPDRTCLIGHTHLACAWTPSGGFTESPEGNLNSHRLINCGSVGQPRDRDPDAAYLMVDTDAGTWSHIRVHYDIDSAADKIRRAGLPDVLWQRLYGGR